MKTLMKTVFAVTGIFASALSYAATVTIDINSLTPGTVTSSTPLELNSFTTLSTDGELLIDSPMFGGPGLTIGSAGDTAFFNFDTSAVAVSGITLTGTSNNVPVTITTFDLDGLQQDVAMTDNNWTSQATILNLNPISSFSVELLESEISGITIQYDTVSAVPVPAAALLFGSGLIGLAGISRRRKS